MFVEQSLLRSTERQRTSEIGNLGSYSKLLELVRSNQIEIIHVLSTPRSSSTALERALYQSDAVDLQINDAWANYDTEDREQKTYEHMLLEIKNNLRAGEKIKVIIKSVADYIPPGEAFERMCDLSSHTILLTRNPLLQMESMMKIMAESIGSDEVIVNNLTMNQYAQNLGYENWQAMRTRVNQQKSYAAYESIYAVFFPSEQKIHSSAAMRSPILHNIQESVIKRTGFDSKDAYAAAHGYRNWQHFLASVDERPELLDDHAELLEAIFLCRITGWDAMLQHMSQLDGSKHSYTVIDSTMFRALPEEYLTRLAGRAGLTYSEQVVDWSRKSKTFVPGDDEGVSYYQKVIESSGVQPPVEVPITIEQFPLFIQEHLTEVGGAFSTYLLLIKKHLDEFGDTQVRDLIKVDVNGTALQEIDPVFTYALLAGVEHLSMDQQRVRNTQPRYAKEFELIDSLSK